MTELESVQIVSAMTVAFPKADWSDEYQRMFAERIRDIDYPVARRAALMVIETCVFPPAIAEFRKAVVEQGRGLRRPALDAWADVVRAIRRVGALYGDDDKAPRFADVVCQYVVDRMGWNQLCRSDTPDGVIEKRFCDFYDAVQDNTDKLEQLSDQAMPLLQAPKMKELAAKIAGIGRGAA